MEKVLLECYCDGGLPLHQTTPCIMIKIIFAYLSTGTEASQPDCKASLAKKLMALFGSDRTWTAIHIKDMLAMVWSDIPGWKVMFVAIA